MANLVPIPWQPNYFLTPDTLALLKAAGNKLGVNLQVNDAWRSYAEQAGYYAKYVSYLHGGPYAPPASNPDNGQRNHMRGAAFDLKRTDATVQAACRSVGLIRDPDESWHWNNPYWARMPIIPVNDTTTAGGNATPLEDDLTPDQDRKLQAILDAVFIGGTSMSDDKKSIQQSLGEIHKIVARPVIRDGKPVEQIQDNADTNTLVRSLLAQVAALAESLKK